MSWTAIVPVKTQAERKTRLAGTLSREERSRLSEALRHHVLEILRRSPDVSSVAILSQERPGDWTGTWIADEGRGLNAELEAAARALGGVRIFVMHADLPCVGVDDIAALLAAAKDGIAIAPDRHGTGTNALALSRSEATRFAFGEDSFRRHRDQAGDKAHVVTRSGLGLDIDTPDDLAVATAAGFRY